MMVASAWPWMAVCAAEDPSRPQPILILFSNDRLLPADLRLDEGLRSVLEGESAQPVTLYTEFLDAIRFPGEEREQMMADYLQARYVGNPPRALVAMGPQATSFFLKRRTSLFAGTPLVFGAVNQRNPAGGFPVADLVGKTLDVPLVPTLELMMALIPRLREVVVIFWASPFEQRWGEAAKREFAPYEDRVKVTYWNAEPFAAILEKARKLPPDSAIFFFAYLEAPNGVTMASAVAAKQLAEAASVPVFGIFDTYLGTGVVGGKMTDFFGEGAAVGRIVQRVLSGEAPGKIGVLPPSLQRFVFDARQLGRWKISEKDLPKGSEVLFGKPSVWRDHPALVTGIIAAVVAQSALIASLLINRARRKRFEEALRVSEERYREVLESQTNMVCRYLADTTLTFVNEAYCRFIGRTREDLLGVRFLEFIPSEWHEQLLTKIAALRSERHSISTEHEVLLPDGSVGWHHWEDYAIVNDRGEVVEYQAIGQDISERKRAEEATQKLSQSARLLLLGEITASISHELNQPLGAILSNADAAELLLDRESPPLDELRGIVADIRKDDLRASNIIRHIRVLLGKREIQMAPVDLNEMACDVIQLAGAETRRRGVSIEMDLAEQLPLVSGDRVQLQQVLLNFIINGMDAMKDVPQNRRRLVVRTQPVANSNLEISVTDTGHGIPEEKLPRIFESFFTTKEDGMGLGLAITRSIAEAHRGQVSADNNPDGGATFRFTLPSGTLSE